MSNTDKGNIQADIGLLRDIARNILLKINAIINEGSEDEDTDKLFATRGSLITSLISIADLLFKLDQYEKSMKPSGASTEMAVSSLPISERDVALVERFLAKIRLDTTQDDKA